MNYCQKCKKKVPTVKVGDKSECMICGTETISDQKENFTNKTTAKSLKEMQELTKIDPDTGKYTNASKVGRNISSGLLIIMIGFLYSYGGISGVILGVATIIIALLLTAITIYVYYKFLEK